MKSFTITDTLDREEWYRFVCDHPKSSIFHTPHMMDVFARTYHQQPFFRAAVDPTGQILALLSAVYVQTLRDPFGLLSSRSILYAEPLCVDTDEGQAALASVVAEHDRHMRHRVLFTEVRPLYAAGRERAALEPRGYLYEDYLNFLIDLRRPKEKLLAAMTSTCRARIRRGEREGVHVEEMNTPEGVDLLYQFLSAAYERARVPLADKSLFANALRVLGASDKIKIFVGFLQDRPIGGSAVLLFKERVYEWFSAAERPKSISPAESFTWHRIEWGQQHGYGLYDFGGAGWPDKPYGVRDFKAKFGPQLVHYGRYRKIYSSLRFSLAEHGYNLMRNAINPRRWSPAR